MERKVKLKYMTNPALGLVPFLLYTLLYVFLSFQTAVLSTAVISVVLTMIYRHKLKAMRVYNYMLIFGNLSFILAVLTIPLKSFELLSFDIRFLWIVALQLQLLIAQRYSRKFMRLAMRGKTPLQLLDIKKSLFEFFFVTSILTKLLGAYLLINGIYLYLLTDWHSPELHYMMIDYSRTGIILLLMLYEYVRIKQLNLQFQKEDWLPIIDEQAKVIGRIAKSVSYQFKERYLHPRVRIYIFCKGMLYLSVRRSDDPFAPHKYDTPLKEDLKYKQEFDDLVRRTLYKSGLPLNIKARFIFRHLFESDNARRMQFLYKVSIDDETLLRHKVFQNGKLWSEQEIERNINKCVFSECFESEFDLLQTTIFPIERLMMNLDHD